MSYYPPRSSPPPTSPSSTTTTSSRTRPARSPRCSQVDDWKIRSIQKFIQGIRGVTIPRFTESDSGFGSRAVIVTPLQCIAFVLPTVICVALTFGQTTDGFEKIK